MHKGRVQDQLVKRQLLFYGLSGNLQRRVEGAPHIAGFAFAMLRLLDASYQLIELFATIAGVNYQRCS